MKQVKDITEYSNDELSLWVMNDEKLYNIRHSSDLRTTLDKLFIFTENQWNTLIDDLEVERLMNN